MTPNPTVKPMEALKPCPWCGDQPTFTSMSRDDHGHVLGCNNGPKTCPPRPTVWARTKAEAIAAWNRRVSVQQEAGEAPTLDFASFCAGYRRGFENASVEPVGWKMDEQWEAFRIANSAILDAHDQQVVSPPLVQKEKK